MSEYLYLSNLECERDELRNRVDDPEDKLGCFESARLNVLDALIDHGPLPVDAGDRPLVLVRDRAEGDGRVVGVRLELDLRDHGAVDLTADELKADYHYV